MCRRETGHALDQSAGFQCLSENKTLETVLTMPNDGLNYYSISFGAKLGGEWTEHGGHAARFLFATVIQ
jgi:hypothetical protein